MTWTSVEKIGSAQGRKCVPVRWQPKIVERAEIQRKGGETLLPPRFGSDEGVHFLLLARWRGARPGLGCVG